MASSASRPGDARRISWSRRGLALPASKVWPAVLAGAAFLVLLVAFDQVVRGAVIRGELRRQAEAQHTEATWRCKAVRGSGASQACLAQLKQEPGRAP